MSVSIATRVTDETKDHIQRSLRGTETPSQFVSIAIEHELIRRRVSVPEREVTIKELDERIKKLQETNLEQSLNQKLILSKLDLVLATLEK